MMKGITDRATAVNHLRRALNARNAEFRDGQWEAIEQVVQESARLLIVQRTGWGKSMVYFIATKLLRERGKGPTLLISPLLSLMRNQLVAAERLGLRAETINSSNTGDWSYVHDLLRTNSVDLLMISPERLGNEEFRATVLQGFAGNVGLLVVDEAHCISDWGHDFRPDYRRIVRLLRVLPMNVPVLAVTATANNRVVDDVVSQIGDLRVQRGTLARETLRLQNIVLHDQSSRLAWTSETLRRISGSGIVYTLTVHDAERVASWLRLRGLDVHAYHADIDGRRRAELEIMLIENRVKALVATTALGMGFDKPDLSFVIHFQRPASVIHYYQQVGRAGRGLAEARGILLSGAEDDEIADYFQKTALPPRSHVEQVLSAIEKSRDGLSLTEIEREANLSRSQIDKVLRLLTMEEPTPVVHLDRKWRRTATAYAADNELHDRLLALRKREVQKMRDYVQCKTCLMLFLQRELDDPTGAACGVCANCDTRSALSWEVSHMEHGEAQRFLNRAEERIESRKLWPQDAMAEQGWRGKISSALMAEEGRTLCRWGDAGWGQRVKVGKYDVGRYDDELVRAASDLIKERWPEANAIEWVSCVPSLRHPRLVQDMAERLARALGLEFRAVIVKKKESAAQKEMRNGYQQAKNLAGIFDVNKNLILPSAVLLVDDMVDSRWTFTVAAALLREAGSGPVFPFALAKVFNG